MIDNCISLIRKKEERKYREKIYQRYITNILKTFLESYYSAHNGSINVPDYKDYDEVLEREKKPEKVETAEEIKNRIFGQLDKLGKS